MTKKSLIILAVIALFAGTVQAHDPWPIEYSVKAPPTVSSVGVETLIVMWADVYFATEDQTIVLTQTSGDQFDGCIELMLCVNFVGLDVIAEIVPNTTTGDVVSATKWLVQLAADELKHATPIYGSQHGFEENKTKFNFQTLGLTGSNIPFQLCVRLEGMDPQSHAYTVGEKKQIAVVNLTLLPTNDVTGYTYDP